MPDHKPQRGGARPGAGRPRTSTVVKVRVPTSDWALWQDLADRQGISLSEAVREAMKVALARGSTR